MRRLASAGWVLLIGGALTGCIPGGADSGSYDPAPPAPRDGGRWNRPRDEDRAPEYDERDSAPSRRRESDRDRADHRAEVAQVILALLELVGGQ